MNDEFTHNDVGNIENRQDDSFENQLCLPVDVHPHSTPISILAASLPKSNRGVNIVALD